MIWHFCGRVSHNKIQCAIVPADKGIDMGILDDLKESMGGGGSSKGGGQVSDPNDTTNLGLGGLKSLLGTRGPAGEGARGDAQMAKTLGDSLPGYFDPTTRDYVPWYVDLFNGGGINAAGGSEGQTEQGGAMNAQSAIGAMRPQQRATPQNIGFSDMELANRSQVGVDPRNLGGSEGYGPMGIDPRNLGGSEGYGPMGIDPRNLGGSEGYGPMGIDPRNLGGSEGYGQQGMLSPPAEAAPTASSKTRDSVLNDLRGNVYTTGPVEGILNSFQEPEGFNQNVRGSDGTSFIPYGVPKPGEGLGVETFGSGNAYSNQHYSVDPAFPAFIKSFPEALEQPSVIPLLLAQYKAKRGL